MSKENNEHSFSSNTTPSQSFFSKVGTPKTFFSTITKQQWFESTIVGFTKTTSWLATFTADSAISIPTIMGNFFGVTASFSGSVVTSVNRTDTIITHKPQTTIHSFVPIVARINEIKNMGVATFQSISSMVVNSLENIPLFGVLFSNGNLPITATATVVKMYVVSDWDSSLLSVLDSKTLNEMDYQVL